MSPNNDKENRDARINVRLEPSVYAELLRQAEADNRSVSSCIQHVIKCALEGKPPR